MPNLTRLQYAYTDYPLPEHQGVVKVQLLAYDRNKYVTVDFQGFYEGVKSGYLFADAALTKHLTWAKLYSLPRSVEHHWPTRKEVAAELKARRKRKTHYFLWLGDERRSVGTLKAALRLIARDRRKVDCMLDRRTEFMTTTLLETERGSLVRYTHRGRPHLKRRHLQFC